MTSTPLIDTETANRMIAERDVCICAQADEIAELKLKLRIAQGRPPCPTYDELRECLKEAHRVLCLHAKDYEVSDLCFAVRKALGE